MKTLLLLRHAKSSWEDPSLSDFDRPLNERGVGDAKLMGKFICKMKIDPDLIVSSPAERARQTTELVLTSSGLQLELRFDARIYEASTRRLLEVISQIEDTVDTVMLVGHNPGFEELVEALTNTERGMPTAALACIELRDNQWKTVGAGKGQPKWLVTPKDLKRA